MPSSFESIERLHFNASNDRRGRSLSGDKVSWHRDENNDRMNRSFNGRANSPPW